MIDTWPGALDALMRQHLRKRLVETQIMLLTVINTSEQAQLLFEAPFAACHLVRYLH
jgi:hypothetical protein